MLQHLYVFDSAEGLFDSVDPLLEVEDDAIWENDRKEFFKSIEKV